MIRFFCLHSTILFVSLSAYSQEQRSDRPRQILEIAELNTSGLLSFDVLVRKLHHADREEAGFTHNVELQRIAISFEDQKYVELISGQREEAKPTIEQGLVVQESQLLTCRITEGLDTQRRAWPSPVRRRTHNSFRDGIAEGCAISLPFSGYVPFMSIPRFACQGGAETHSSWHRQVWSRIHADWGSADVAFRGEVPHKLSRLPLFNARMDRHTLVNVSLDNHQLPRLLEVLQERDGKRWRTYNEFLKWEEVSGLWVPIEISCDKLQGMFFGENGERHVKYEDSVTFEFYWLSINEPLPKELSGDLWDDPQRVRELVDPELLGIQLRK